MFLSPPLREAIYNKDRIVILAGAGMSAESGVPTFRGADGLWRNFKPEELASPDAFNRDPKLVWEWYNWRRDTIGKCRPNPAHLAVAQLQRIVGDRAILVTQNVDGLHRDAGTARYLEVHGCIWDVCCSRCGLKGEYRDIPNDTLPPKCGCGGLVRPNVVWYGEALPEKVLNSAFRAAGECKVMLVIGTSAVVYPIAYLPNVAKENGAYIIEVNLERTPISAIADEVIIAPAGKAVPGLLGISI